MDGESHLRARIQSLEGKFKGHRCFMVGNGPSLKDTPLDLIKNEYSFGMNGIAGIFPTTEWRPTFFVSVGNGILFPHYTPTYRAAIATGALSFVNRAYLRLVCPEQDGIYSIPRNVIPVKVTFKHPVPTPDASVWSYDISDSVSKDGSTMVAAFQIATYMGFNPIYLVGCDLGLKPWDWEKEDDPNHFSGDYWGKLEVQGTPYKMTPEHASETQAFLEAGHHIIKTVCTVLRVDVYNATVGGELEAYPRVDFRGLFA
jgi:hypothetical protein